jgi:hypothetical protein
VPADVDVEVELVLVAAPAIAEAPTASAPNASTAIRVCLIRLVISSSSAVVPVLPGFDQHDARAV